MRRILGIDICHNRAVCWLVTGISRNPKQSWKDELKSDKRTKEPLKDPLTFFYNTGGIKELLSLKPDAIVMEPTGVHYSKLIAEVCQQQGIKVLWVGHVESSNYRKSLKLPNKNDLADAFALGYYGFLYFEQPSYFIEFQPGKLAEIREKFLQIKSLNRFNTPLISRLKQQLSYEFPEAMDVNFRPSIEGRRAFTAWLSNRRKSSYWDRRYLKSVAHEYNINFSEFSLKLANFIDDYDQWIFELKNGLKELVYSVEFKEYNRVFNEFGFHLGLRSIILGLVYPIENFGSIGAFKRRLGLALTEISSGSKAAWKSGNGSKLARTEFYLWVANSITDGKIKKGAQRPNSITGKIICNWYDEQKLKYSENPEIFKKKEKEKLVNKTVKSIEESLNEIFTLEQIKQLEGTLKLVRKTLLDDATEPSDFKVHARFGNLLLDRTAAYSVRWLYRRLKAVTKP